MSHLCPQTSGSWQPAVPLPRLSKNLCRAGEGSFGFALATRGERLSQGTIWFVWFPPPSATDGSFPMDLRLVSPL